MSALKSAIAWVLAAERGKSGAETLRNTLNGTTGITSRQESYIVNIPVGKGSRAEWATFAWGNPERANIQGHSDHPPVFLSTKEEAFAAAVRKSREIHDAGDVTLASLRQRFLDRSASGKGGELKVDSGLPNIFLLWNKDGSDLKVRAYCSRNYIKYGRSYAFPCMPASSDDDSDKEDDNDLPDQPDVSVAERWDVVQMRADEFAALSEHERSKHRLFRCPGFELTEQPVKVNPYFLGLWLGDGTRRNTSIASNHEAEVREFLVNHAAELDLHLVYHGDLQYATVGRTRLADRPLPPLVEAKNPPRLAVRRARQTILKQRFATSSTTARAGEALKRTRHASPDEPSRRRHRSTSVIPDSTDFGSSQSLPVHQQGTAPAEDPDDIYGATPERQLPTAPETVPNADALRRRVVAFTSDLDSHPPSSQGHRSSIDPHDSDAQSLPQSSSVPRAVPEASIGQRPMSSPADLIPEDAMEQLLSDDTVMKAVTAHGTLDVPGSSDEEDFNVHDDIVDDDIIETFEVGDDSDEESTESAQVSSRIRLGIGQRKYGDLREEEAEQLLDNIVDRPKDALGSNHLLRALDELQVLSRGTGPHADRKHIPPEYMKNSRSVRLALLAGLIDSDGWYIYPENMYGFAQSETWHENLFWDTVALARSLGLGVWTTKRMMWNPMRTKKFPALFAQISGNVAEVPCLLARKKADQRFIPQTHSFIIKDINLEEDETEWYGFRVDQDQLYLRHDYLVLHNSGFEESMVSIGRRPKPLS